MSSIHHYIEGNCIHIFFPEGYSKNPLLRLSMFKVICFEIGTCYLLQLVYQL